MTKVFIDHSDVLQALAIALGDRIASGMDSPQSVGNRKVETLKRNVQRFLAELPPDTSVQELLDLMEDL